MTEQPKGKGKGKGPAGPAKAPGGPPAAGKGLGKGKTQGGFQIANLKPDEGMLFYRQHKSQHEDGHWDAAIFESCVPKVFKTEGEKESFEADSPYLSTLVLQSMCRSRIGAISSSEMTKKEKEVKLGDGRGQADEVEYKTVALTDQELQEKIEERERQNQDMTERVERAERFLVGHPMNSQRHAMEEKATAVLQLFKLLDKTGSASQVKPDRREISTEEKAAKDEERRKKEMAMQQLKIERMSRLRKLGPAGINHVQWSKMRELHYVDGGSGGVMLADVHDGVVVLKLQLATASNELMAQYVADALGVRVGHVRIVKRGEAEMQQIKDAAMNSEIHGCDKSSGLRTFFGLENCPEEAAKVRMIKDASDVGFFGVLEYAAGHVLMGIEGSQCMSSPTPDLLHQLGHLCALDVLINNLDRIPLPVWQNEGNLGNVMIIDGGKCVLGIDQQVNLVAKGSGMDNYLNKVTTMVKDSMPGGNPSAIVAKLQQAVMENCGTALSETDAVHVVTGMHDGFRKIMKSWSTGALKKQLDAAEAMCFDRFIIDGPCQGKKPNLDIVGGMNEFVCAVAANISDNLHVEFL